MPNPCEYIYESITCSTQFAPITSYDMDEYVDFTHTYPNIKSWGNMYETAGAAETATPKVKARMSIAEEISTEDVWALQFKIPTMAETAGFTDTPKYVPYYAMAEAVSLAGDFGPKVLAKRSISEIISASGLFTPYAYELISESVAATDLFAAVRSMSQLVAETADAADTYIPRIHSRRNVVETVGAAVTLGHRATQGASVSEGISFVEAFWFRNTDVIAWQMNTETTAVNWHTNFQFNSIAQYGNTVFAVEEDGVYVLTGDTDQTVNIDSSVKTGFMDFGDHHTKRLDNIYFGLRGSDLQMDLEVFGAAAPETYTMPAKTTVSPGSNRITPGKGLISRYWRMTLSNVDGGDFDINNIEFDVAMSNKRRL